jgi:hypothetical protein
MASAILGALKYLPASMAQKALVKVNPSFGGYFSKALSYGVDANRALDYLLERFESDSQRDYKRQLEQGAAQGTLRPDEKVSRSEMANAALPAKVLKAGASALIGGGLGFGKEQVPAQQEIPELTQQEKKQAAVSQYNERMNKKKKSELSREELLIQFEEAQQGGQGQGKQALLRTMQEITENLRRMRGNG